MVRYNKYNIPLAILLFLMGKSALAADFKFYYPIPVYSVTGETAWMPIESLYSEWATVKALYNCATWYPNSDQYYDSVTYTQTSNTCETLQNRNVQKREKNTKTGQIRNSGEVYPEENLLKNQTATRSYSINYSDWQLTGTPYNCTNWTPSPATVYNDKTFTQTATNCIQDSVKKRTETYVDHLTKETVPVTTITYTAIAENKTATREMQGTKAYYVTTPYNLTDGNWTKGIGKVLIAFFVVNTEDARTHMIVGNKVRFANGEIREIVKTTINDTPGGSFYNVHVSGDVMNGNIMGYPNTLTIIEP